MSLKAFHLFFIASSILLALGFGGWELRSFLDRGGAMRLVLAVVSFAGGFFLIVYGLKVRQKLKDLGEGSQP